MAWHKSWLLLALLMFPLELLVTGTSIAQQAPETDKSKSEQTSNNPDLVITEDTRLASDPLTGTVGKAVRGSCEQNKPLWEGKIAIKNIGRAIVEGKPEGSRLLGDKKIGPHVRAYVPNNIELQAEGWLEDDLGEFGQEVIELSIGKGKPKCRNYDAPPVFDERLSGRPGPLFQSEAPPPPPAPDNVSWQVKRIQAVLIDKGYPIPSGADGDYGVETIRAIRALFRDRKQPPPPGIAQRPPPPEALRILFAALGISAEPPPPAVPTGSAGNDECIRGINLVPIYLEIDPLRQIPDENRSNNRVQFTVAIDCSNIAR